MTAGLPKKTSLCGALTNCQVDKHHSGFLSADLNLEDEVKLIVDHWGPMMNLDIDEEQAKAFFVDSGTTCVAKRTGADTTTKRCTRLRHCSASVADVYAMVPVHCSESYVQACPNPSTVCSVLRDSGLKGDLVCDTGSVISGIGSALHWVASI